MSLPESLVLRIERDGVSPVSNDSLRDKVADLAIAPPPADSATGDEASVRPVVRDGAIDQTALAEIDASASTGEPEAVSRAVSAETSASHFEFERGNLPAALEHAERALAFAPDQTIPLLNVAYLHIRLGEYSKALDFVERARRSAPDSADAARLAGWADYGLNRLSQAVAEWTRAQQIKPEPSVGQMLEKAQHELEVESSFREREGAHFFMSYYGGAAPELAESVLGTLEDDFEALSTALNYVPTQSIPVILYTNEAFQDITQVPSWVGALNDGKIRVPVQGLQSVTPELAHVLKHELTHSFVAQKTHGRAPVWLQEGAAQWMEGKRSQNSAAALLRLYDQHQDPSLTYLEGSWMNLPQNFVAEAYAWSLAVVEGIEATGPGDLERLLDRIAEGASAESAFREALHLSYADLNSATADYLHRTY